MKLDALLPGPLATTAVHAERLEGAGVDGVYTFEGPHDVFAPLVLAAAATRLTVYPNVAVAFPRSPVHLAHIAHDLQALSGGRAMLGLGSQVRAHVERRYGAEFDHPVERLCEVVAAVQEVLRCWQHGEPLDFRGRFTTHTLMPPLFDPGPLEHGPPPVLVGAVGPRMTRGAATVADGLILHPFNTDRFVRHHTLPIVADGLAAAGRAADRFQVVAGAIVATGRTTEERETSTAAARQLVSFYASTRAYRPVLAAEGMADLQPRLHALTRAGRWDEMPALVGDDLLDLVVVRAEPDGVVPALTARYGDVADRVAFQLIGTSDPELVEQVVRSSPAR